MTSLVGNVIQAEIGGILFASVNMVKEIRFWIIKCVNTVLYISVSCYIVLYRHIIKKKRVSVEFSRYLIYAHKQTLEKQHLVIEVYWERMEFDSF